MYKQTVLFSKVASGWGDDGALSDYNFAVLLDGLADVVFAYEVGGLFGSFYTLR